jgi:hypothetical protein
MTFISMGMLLMETLVVIQLIGEFRYHPKMIIIVMPSVDIRRPSTTVEKV